MVELLKQLLEFLNSAWGVVEFLINGIISFVEIILTLPKQVIGFLSFLPAEILGPFMAVITLVIAYKVVGRD